MGHSGTYINSKPVLQLADIKAVLGENVNDLGALCTSNNVNMWSKRKPVRSSQQTEMSDANMASVQYGLTWSRYSTAQALLNAVASLGEGVLAWSYNKPRGKSYSEYFRRLDFYQYQHAAVCPMILAPSANGVYAVDPSPYLIDNSPIQPANGNLKISDLGLGNLNLVYRAGTSGSVNTQTNVGQGTSLPYSGTGTNQYGLYYKVGTYYIPAPYPFFTLSVESFFGIGFGTKNVNVSTSGVQLSVTVHNEGRSRLLNAVSLHRRKEGNYSRNADGTTYTITPNASAVAADYEQDITVGVSATYDDNPASVNLGNGSLERSYRFTVNPYGNDGLYFIRIQYTYNTASGGTNTKDMYLQLNVHIPINP